MDEFKTKKRILDRYKTYTMRLHRLKDKLETVISNLGAKSVRYSDVPKGFGSSDTSDLTIEKIELEERISKLEPITKEMKLKILNAIEKLDNDNYSAVIELFYIDFMNMNEIACELNCGYSTVKRYLKKAISSINIDDLK